MSRFAGSLVVVILMAAGLGGCGPIPEQEEVAPVTPEQATLCGRQYVPGSTPYRRQDQVGGTCASVSEWLANNLRTEAQNNCLNGGYDGMSNFQVRDVTCFQTITTYAAVGYATYSCWYTTC